MPKRTPLEDLERVERQITALEKQRNELPDRIARMQARLDGIEPQLERLKRRRDTLHHELLLEAIPQLNRFPREGEPVLGAELGIERDVVEEEDDDGRRHYPYKGLNRETIRRLAEQKRAVMIVYVFTFERRDGPESALRPWAVALFSPASEFVTFRFKAADGAAIRRRVDHAIGSEVHASLIDDELARLHDGDEITSVNADALYAALEELDTLFSVARGTKRGSWFIQRDTLPLRPRRQMTVDEEIDRIADRQFADRSVDMSVTNPALLP